MSDTAPYLIEGPALLITDIHQNLKWAKDVIEKEKGNYTHIVFGGDFFDSFYQPDSYNEPTNGISGVKDTAQFVIEITEGKYGPNTILCGNHDLGYMEAWRWCSQFQSPRIKNFCSGFTKSKAAAINHILEWSHWRHFKTFVLVNGYLVSHAGFLPSFWPPELDAPDSKEKNLLKLWHDTDRALEEISYMPSAFFKVGYSRGGDTSHPGPYWVDFSDEFVDAVPYQQIVGHTSKYNTIRKIGNSYCIDGMQTTYCVINERGVQFKSLKDGKYIEPKIIKLEPNKISDGWQY